MADKGGDEEIGTDTHGQGLGDAAKEGNGAAPQGGPSSPSLARPGSGRYSWPACHSGCPLFLSEILAVGSAVCIALSSMFISALHGRVEVIRLARWQFVMAFFMTGAIALWRGGWQDVGLDEVKALALSSLFGIAIASTTYFAAIYTAGPRVTSLLFSLASPFALALGYFGLGETIGAWQVLGVSLVLLRIVLAIGGTGDGERSKGASRLLLWGIALGVITALGQALGGYFARPAMAAGVEPFTAVAARAGLAALFCIALMAHPRGRPRDRRFRARDLGLAALASFFGNTLGMALLMAALESGKVGIVTTLSSMTPIAILPMVWMHSGKRPPLMAWLGAAVAIVGTGLISLG